MKWMRQSSRNLIPFGEFFRVTFKSTKHRFNVTCIMNISGYASPDQMSTGNISSSGDALLVLLDIVSSVNR